MKKLMLFLGLIIFSCSGRENKIELIENYDEIYLPAEKLDKTPSTKEIETNLAPLFNKIFTKHIGYDKIENSVMITYKLFIDEEGLIRKVQRFSSSLNNAVDLSRIYNGYIEPEILQMLEKLRFESGYKSGEKVKFQLLMMFAMLRDIGEIKPRVFMNLIDRKTDLSTDKFLHDWERVYFVSVDESPFPIDGIAGLTKNIKYPEEAKKKKIEGTVLVKAFIDEMGNVNEAEVIKGTGSPLDTAAVNAVIKTKFLSGKQSGIPVKVQVAVPIVFKLK